MSDPVTPGAPSHDHEAAAGLGPRERHDAFNGARKAAFVAALIETGCVTEAAARVRVSTSTVYRYQADSPAFLDDCAAAIRMSATPLELTAWRRAVEGVEQEFACGGQVHVRRRYDGSLLRLLLQGSNPKKYGARPGFKRKRIYRHERKQMEKELRAKIRAEREANAPPIEEVRDEILRRLGRIRSHREEERLAAGWTRTADGDMIPPGYGPIPGWTAPDGQGSAPQGARTPRDSMWKSSQSSPFEC